MPVSRGMNQYMHNPIWVSFQVVVLVLTQGRGYNFLLLLHFLRKRRVQHAVFVSFPPPVQSNSNSPLYVDCYASRNICGGNSSQKTKLQEATQPYKSTNRKPLFIIFTPLVSSLVSSNEESKNQSRVESE